MTPFWQSKPPIYLGRARRESLHAQAPHRAGDGLASGHRVNLLERYDYPTCGTYDAAGDCAYRVGLPCKSGVGGGIVAVVPGRLTLCVWSPALDPQGNSLLGLKALELFSGETGLSIF